MANSDAIQRWEYLSVQALRDPFAIDVTRELNHWGRVGWELVAVEHGCYIFKRPLKVDE